MDPVPNPYAPGAGRPPAALVGRDSQIERWRIALDRIEASRTVQPLVLYGLRGVGKTVLLTRFFNTARDRNWIAAQVEAGAGKSLRETLGEALYAPLADLARPSAGKRLLKGPFAPRPTPPANMAGHAFSRWLDCPACRAS